jgi:hypothetical protein
VPGELTEAVKLEERGKNVKDYFIKESAPQPANIIFLQNFATAIRVDSGK